MKFSLNKSIEILERTPKVISSLLEHLSDDWTMQNEGPDTWGPFDVVGHLIHCEKTDWMPRAKIILEQGEAIPFKPFDRFAQYEDSKGKTLADLLDEFASRRAENLAQLNLLNLTEPDFEKTGIHPSLGKVSLKNLLATWTAHDLGHIAQITRVMAKLYKDETGVWAGHLGILSR
jgi:hypothetical protein